MPGAAAAYASSSRSGIGIPGKRSVRTGGPVLEASRLGAGLGWRNTLVVRCAHAVTKRDTARAPTTGTATRRRTRASMGQDDSRPQVRDQWAWPRPLRLITGMSPYRGRYVNLRWAYPAPGAPGPG